MATDLVGLFDAQDTKAQTRQAAKTVLNRLEGLKDALDGFAAMAVQLDPADKPTAKTWALTIPTAVSDHIQTLLP